MCAHSASGAVITSVRMKAWLALIASWKYIFKQRRLLWWNLKICELQILSLFSFFPFFWLQGFFLVFLLPYFQWWYHTKCGDCLCWSERTECFLQICSPVLTSLPFWHTHVNRVLYISNALLQDIVKVVMLYMQLLSLQRTNVMKGKSEYNCLCPVKVECHG